MLGAVIGSFLNVCIWRLPRGKSIVSPASHCPRCGHPIAWYDNIPVLSYLVLGGHCRHCRARIPLRYPLVELATAALFGANVYIYGLSVAALVAVVFLTLLLGMAVTDAMTYLIPDPFTLGGALLGLACSFFPGGLATRGAVVGGVVGAGLMWVLRWLGSRAFRREAIGMGDVKMMAAIGAFLGWVGVAITVIVGSILGTLIFGPVALKTRRLVPFGTFLALGAFVSFYWGNALLAWYVGLW